MLPDGAHARAEDWTVFFLKDPINPSTTTTSSNQSQRPGTASSSRSRASSLNPSRQNENDEVEAERERNTSPIPNSASNRASQSDGRGLTYVLNLVRTKHDNSVRR